MKSTSFRLSQNSSDKKKQNEGATDGEGGGGGDGEVEGGEQGPQGEHAEGGGGGGQLAFYSIFGGGIQEGGDPGKWEVRKHIFMPVDLNDDNDDHENNQKVWGSSGIQAWTAS